MHNLAALVVVVGVAFAPLDVPLDVPSQCADPHYARAHPTICVDGVRGSPGPFPPFPGGGGSDGGLLGELGRALHSLTGGLL